MVSAKEIASKVRDPAVYASWRKHYPVAGDQKTILDALGITANNFSHAEAIFRELGIAITGNKQDGSCDPIVERKRFGLSHGEWGEPLPDVDLSAIEQYMRER